MSTTPNLSLFELAAGQSQKHVTVNEAFRILDAAVQLSVKDKDLAAPPGSPADGDCYIVAGSATGAWVGQSGKIAYCVDAAWRFLVPKPGWTTWVNDEDRHYVYSGSAWRLAPAPTSFNRVGVNGATGNATNPLSTKGGVLHDADATTGDQRTSFNKATAGDDAALTFQTDYSARARLGLLANDDFTFKVSPNGSTYYDAIVIDKDDGQVKHPAAPKFQAYCDFGQNYAADAWADLYANNTRHNDQGAFSSVSNVGVFTAPHDGYYMIGASATFETPGTIPTKMEIGLSVNAATPTGDTVDTTGDATITTLETSVRTQAVLKLTAGQTVRAMIRFTTNGGRVAADLNSFWGFEIP